MDVALRLVEAPGRHRPSLLPRPSPVERVAAVLCGVLAAAALFFGLVSASVPSSHKLLSAPTPLPFMNAASQAPWSSRRAILITSLLGAGVAKPAQAIPGDNCVADCEDECLRLAPGNGPYCRRTCDRYCERDGLDEEEIQELDNENVPFMELEEQAVLGKVLDNAFGDVGEAVFRPQ
eukprot:EG_transcript_29497